MKKREKQIWDAAIDAAVAQLKMEFVAPEVVIAIIEKVKKKPLPEENTAFQNRNRRHGSGS